MGTRATKSEEVVVKVVVAEPATNDVVVDEDLNLDMDMGDLVEVRSEEDRQNERMISQIRGFPGDESAC